MHVLRVSARKRNGSVLVELVSMDVASRMGMGPSGSISLFLFAETYESHVRWLHGVGVKKFEIREEINVLERSLGA